MTLINTSGWLPNEGNPSVRVSPERGDSLGPQEAPWHFPPGSPGSSAGPSVPPDFREWLKSHDERMEVAWHPVLERHIIWCRNRRGDWSVSLLCENRFSYRWADVEPGDPIPLDSRIKAMLIDSDPRTYGGAQQMWSYLVQRDEKIEQDKLKQEMDRMRDQRERAIMHSSIRVGYGGGRSKFHEMYR